MSSENKLRTKLLMERADILNEKINALNIMLCILNEKYDHARNNGLPFHVLNESMTLLYSLLKYHKRELNDVTADIIDLFREEL